MKKMGKKAGIWTEYQVEIIILIIIIVLGVVAVSYLFISGKGSLAKIWDMLRFGGG